MPRVIKAPSAELDLFEIWEYIAADSINHADAFLDLLEEKCALLAEQPLMGPERPEYGRGLRSFAVESYVIYYYPLDDGIEIARFLHGAQEHSRFFH